MAFAVLSTEGNAQAHRFEGPAAGLNEAGTPPFAILSQESLGLSSKPTDLHLMPDGRILVVAPQQLALGDGVRWKVFHQSLDDPSPAGTGVAVHDDGSIYIGTSSGFGRIKFVGNNEWQIVQAASWPAGEQSDRTIPRTAVPVQDEWIWHSGSGSVMAWTPGQIARVVGRSDDVEHVFSLNGTFYLSDANEGALFQIDARGMKPLLSPERVSPSSAVTSALPFAENSLLVGTQGEGLQMFDGTSLRPFLTGKTLGGIARINDICKTEGGMFAAAVENHGIIFFDREGRTVQSLSRSLDHRLSGVKRLIPAAGGVIWGLLDRAIVRVEFPSRISYFEPLVGTGVNTAHPYRLNGRLWFLADGKIQRALYDADGNLGELETDMPENLYAFTFSSAMGVPIAGTSRGAFFRDQTGWVLFAPETHNLRVLENKSRNGRWLYAARGEVGWLSRTESGIEIERISKPDLPNLYNAATEKNGTVWVELGSGRFGRISFEGEQVNFREFNTSHGIPDSWAQVFEIEGVVRFNVAQQILRFDAPTDRFVRDPEFEQLTSLSEIYGRPGIDSEGRLWVTTLTGLHVLEQQAGHWRKLPIQLSPQFRPYFFTFESDGVVWMHSERRLERYDHRMPSATPAPLQAIFTQVNVPAGNRSFFPADGNMPELDYSENSLLFYFSAPGNRFNTPVTFEVNLEGADTDWTSAGSSGSAVFNRLKEGHYTLRVRPRTDQTIGKEAVMPFAIQPPWYRTNLAYAGYALSGLGLLLSAARVSSFLERRENSRLEQLVAIRTQELNASSDRLAAQVHEIRMLSQAIEQSPVSVFITQLDGTIVFANPRACESIGYSSEELVSRKIASIRAESSLANRSMIDGEEVLPRGTPWRGQLANRHKDGRIVHVRTMIAPIRTPDGLVLHQLILEEDITEWLKEQERGRKLEAQLFQAKKMESIGTLAGGIAHDFNNILTGILGYCELARLAARGNPAIVDELKEVFTAGMRAKDLVKQILTFSRKSSVQLIPVDLAEPANEALKLIRASTPTSIQIVSRIENGWVRADATQIQQVVLNLCTNAIHAMKARAGVLTVIVQRITVDTALAAEISQLTVGPWMRLSVADNGQGMDACTLDRIFDPFFTTKRQGEGTGLGLSIVQGVVIAHKGAMRVRSHPDTGTTFEVYFSLTTDELPVPAVERLVPQGAKQEIMVVDDERAVAKFAATRLQQIGYTTTMFFEPLAALAAFTAAPRQFHAIVTDLTMPDLTGLELIKQIRAHGRDVPAVIITGYGSDSVRASLDALANCIVLQKPFSGDELATALDHVLNGATNLPQA